MTMNRRDFLAAASAAAGAVGLARAAEPGTTPEWMKRVPADAKITRVTSFELEMTRPKHVGKNSYRHDHGPKAFERIVRFYTNTGVDGFGPCWSGANECAAFLGKSPLEFLDAGARAIRSPLGRYTTPVWDLLGKLAGKPVYELLGGSAGDVGVYDGSIYMIDLRPQFHAGGWESEFKRELDAGLAAGHRGFKVKIGRGKLWMLAEEGYRRDLEVLRMIRKHVGPEVLIGADANDGYNFERTRRFVQDTAELKLAFIEEMFQEDVEKYRRLKEEMNAAGVTSLVADGENKRLPQEMRTWVEAPRAVDILQGDMNLFGFEDIISEAALAAPSGGLVAPHNWGSLLGYYLQLQVGRVVPNFYRAEQDPMSSPALVAEGYTIRNGRSSVPTAPGLGLRLVDAALADTACVHFDLRA